MDMTVATDALEQLQQFEAHKRHSSFVGSLLGLSLPERDELLAKEFERFDEELEAARLEANRTGDAIALDGAHLSLTESGDTWLVHPDGRMERDYEIFPGLENLLPYLALPPALDQTRVIDRDALLKATYHAFWSPSATNWQPTRVLEVTGAFKTRLLQVAGWDADTAASLLLLLRRNHYESLLGDVLEPFGLPVTAREESLDMGIFAATFQMSILGGGLTYREHVLAPHEVTAVVPGCIESMHARVGVLDDGSELMAREKAKIEQLIRMLEQGKYLPDSLMLVGHLEGPSDARYDDFEDLVNAHSTQRVASPTREFSASETAKLWEHTREALTEAERRAVDWVCFSQSEKTPVAIGTAMFAALYGIGADPETKAGGEGGLLLSVTVRDYLRRLESAEPGYVETIAGKSWQELTDSELQKAVKQVGVRAQDVGIHLRDRLLRDGKYVILDGMIQDIQGRPLSIPLFVRMNRTLASTFGNFFLKFQNTHPQNAVLLANLDAGETHWVYRAVGKAAAIMTFLARSLAASSIIKTGPIDLAGDAIGRILASDLDGKLGVKASALAAGTLKPAMTFQVGFPLAGSEILDPGTANEHTGYEERRRDKRPPRASFFEHYVPEVGS